MNVDVQVADLEPTAAGTEVTLAYRDQLGHARLFVLVCPDHDAPPLGERYTLQVPVAA